jgi:hypothetical protein
MSLKVVVRELMGLTPEDEVPLAVFEVRAVFSLVVKDLESGTNCITSSGTHKD